MKPPFTPVSNTVSYIPNKTIEKITKAMWKARRGRASKGAHGQAGAVHSGARSGGRGRALLVRACSRVQLLPARRSARQVVHWCLQMLLNLLHPLQNKSRPLNLLFFLAFTGILCCWNVMSNKDLYKVHSKKSRDIFARIKLSSLTTLCAVHGVEIRWGLVSKQWG